MDGPYDEIFNFKCSNYFTCGIAFGNTFIHIIATLLWESVRMKLTLPKWGLGSPPGFSKFQSSMVGIKTPHIEVFFISLESYQSIYVKNGLAWAIWTSTSQVMAKRRAGSQTNSLTPDH